MTREEFSQILADTRKKSGIKMIDLCTKTRMSPKDINRIENAEQDYSIIKCLDILKATNYRLVLNDGQGLYKISSYEPLIASLEVMRIGSCTQSDLAKKAGCSHSAITHIKTKVMRVDTFLKIAEAMQIEIKTEANE